MVNLKAYLPNDWISEVEEIWPKKEHMQQNYLLNKLFTFKASNLLDSSLNPIFQELYAEVGDFREKYDLFNQAFFVETDWDKKSNLINDPRLDFVNSFKATKEVEDSINDPFHKLISKHFRKPEQMTIREKIRLKFLLATNSDFQSKFQFRKRIQDIEKDM